MKDYFLYEQDHRAVYTGEKDFSVIRWLPICTTDLTRMMKIPVWGTVAEAEAAINRLTTVVGDKLSLRIVLYTTRTESRVRKKESRIGTKACAVLNPSAPVDVLPGELDPDGDYTDDELIAHARALFTFAQRNLSK